MVTLHLLAAVVFTLIAWALFAGGFNVWLVALAVGLVGGNVVLALLIWAESGYRRSPR